MNANVQTDRRSASRHRLCLSTAWYLSCLDRSTVRRQAHAPLADANGYHIRGGDPFDTNKCPPCISNQAGHILPKTENGQAPDFSQGIPLKQQRGMSKVCHAARRGAG